MFFQWNINHERRNSHKVFLVGEKSVTTGEVFKEILQTVH